VTQSSPRLPSVNRSRSQSVAAELEQFSLPEINAFFAELGDELSVAILARCSSHLLTSLLEEMNTNTLARMLTVATPRDANVLVAHTPGVKYQQIVDAVDPANKPRIQAMFGIEIQTVSSQTTNRFIRAFYNESCGAVLRQIRCGNYQEQSPIVVVAEDLTYLGYAPLLELLQEKNQDRNVTEFAKYVQPLNGKNSTQSVLSNPHWIENPILPVVDGNNIFLGTVAIKELRLLTGVAPTPEKSTPTLFDSYIDVNTKFIEMLLLRGES
jgi:Mg/Co/Ni transporter MgtE